jgi:HSP20 family protein
MNKLMPFRFLTPSSRRPMWSDFDNLWNQMWGGDDRGGAPAAWNRADVIEESDRYVVKVDVPGFRPDEIAVQLQGDTLTLRGEHKAEENKKAEQYRICERSETSFERYFSFPSAVQADRVEAELADGVLTVQVEPAKPAKVTIKAKDKK